MTRLTQRMQRLEARWRPKRIAAILERVRQCAPADLGTCLPEELTAVDRATCDAIMNQLTDAELEALTGPEAGRLMEMLPDAELEALARGDPAATRRLKRVCERERTGRP